MPKESQIRWLKCGLSVLIVMLWGSCCCLLYFASWIRDNVNPLLIVMEGTTTGDFYVNSFFPVAFPVLVVSSFILLVVGFLGCFGAYTEKKSLLAWFFVAILITFCVEISGGVWGRIVWNLTYEEAEIESMYQTAIKNTHAEQTKEAWSVIHTKFQCCGVRSVEDWVKFPDFQDTCPHSQSSKPCGKIVLEHLTQSNQIRAIPYLATVNGSIQVICLITSAKLLMILCFGDQLKKPKREQQIQTQVHVVQHGGNNKNPQYHPVPMVLYTPQATDNSTRCELKPGVSFPLLQTGVGVYCSGCGVRAFEETQLGSGDLLPRAARRTHWSADGLKMSASRLHADSGYRTQSNKHIHAPKYGANELPAYGRSSSLYLMRHYCHSATLPRRKYSRYSPRWRHPSTGNFVRRLSTIRASGVAVESDSSSTDSSQNFEPLGGSRCYNTEAEESFSELEQCSEDNLTAVTKSTPGFALPTDLTSINSTTPICSRKSLL